MELRLTEIEGKLTVVVTDEAGKDYVINNITPEEFSLSTMGSGYWAITVSAAFK